MSLKATWEKVLEYASSPKQGTLSRKLRKGVKLQINGSDIFENSLLFLGEDFIRISDQSKSEIINAYYDWNSIGSIKTISTSDD